MTAMGITKWLGRDGRWHGRGARRAERRREIRLEGLEERQLLSTITWNRGVNDGFGVYDQLPQAVPGKANSEVARELVDRAIVAWRDVIQDFRFQGVPGITNTYTLNITTFNHPDSGPGAA